MRRVLALVLVVALAGCQTVPVESAPYGADVYVDGVLVGQTPCNFRAWRGVWNEYRVDVRMPGFKPYSRVVSVDWIPDPFLSVLIVFSPLLGSAVPPGIAVALEPDDSCPPDAPGPLQVR